MQFGPTKPKPEFLLWKFLKQSVKSAASEKASYLQIWFFLISNLRAFVNIAVDGRGGFLKVAYNVFDPENLHSCSSKYQDSGVQRIQILAIVEDIPESNWNLGLILSKLKLEEVIYYIAFDLKCANAVLGLSTNSGKYACLYCTGLCSSIS